MRHKLYTSLITAAALLLVLIPQGADAWDRGHAQTFATLPQGATNPEGITVDGYGNRYVSTFGSTGTTSGVGEIFVLKPNGKLLRKLEIADTSTLLLELAFHPQTGELLVIDFGNQRVLSVDPISGAAEVFTTIPGGEGAGPNVLTFDAFGNVYISDSFQGIIWVTDADGNGAVAGVPDVWLEDPLLTTTGVPPFGANGLAFNNDESTLFVTNTGNDTVLSVQVGEDGLPDGSAQVFINSVNGADGLIVDEDDNLWIAANQANEILVVDPSGRAIAKLGDFEGVSKKGAAIGLLFPASLVRNGNFIYVTNLALDLRLFGLAPTADSQWASEVTRATVARIRARLPKIKGLP